MKIRIFFLLFAVTFYNAVNSQTIYDNFEDFKDAVSNANPGDEIILAAGRYEAESITMESVSGSEENPVIIRAESIGADTLDDGTYFDLRHCSYITIQGFVINITEKSNTFKIQTCNNIRITQNILDGSGEPYTNDEGNPYSSVWINLQSLWNDEVGLSHHNHIDHNIFRNKHTLGNMIRVDGTNDLYVSHHDVIEYNYFKNMGPRAENEMEVIRIGWSEMSESDGYCRVSNNLFEECNGDPEIISVKCNKNTISHNTFRRCHGTLSLRHGNESLIEGNFFLGEGAEGTGGIRIYGSDHKIINNYFEGLTGTRWDAPITLTKGDAEEGDGDLSAHFRIERAIIANNTLVNNWHGIEIGFDNNGNYNKDPRDVVMAYNIVSGDTNYMVKYIDAPDNMTWINNIMYPTNDAILGDGVTFSENEVIEQNPNLAFNDSLLYFKATAITPEYSPTSEIVGDILSDIDGQIRTIPTNYGADEYNTETIIYKPLNPVDVGPSTGEYLFVSQTELSFPVSGDIIELSISSNLNWDVIVEEDWIGVYPTNGSGEGIIAISVNENETGLPRTSSIAIQSNNAPEGNELIQTIIISQADSDPPILDVSDELIEFSSDEGSFIVSVSSNIDWTISTENNWIHIEPESGSQNADIVVSVDENESVGSRNGNVSITNGTTLTRNISVKQEGQLGSEIKLNIIEAIASTEQNEPPDNVNIAANVLDGDFNTRWSGQGDGAHISLELDSVCMVSFVKIGFHKGDERTATFDILTSVDGENYTEMLMNITSEISTEPLIIYDFSDIEAKFVRLVGHGNSSNDWNSYTELEVWGWLITDTVVNAVNKYQPKEFNIFPNPSNGNFTITDQFGSDILIYNATGKIVYQKNKLSNNEFIKANLQSGIYFVSIASKNVRKKKKIIVKK